MPAATAERASKRDPMVAAGNPAGALLLGRICLVTGAARGLGLAILRAFAAAGGRGIAVDRAPPDDGAELPPGFAFHVADVAREAQIAAALAGAREEFGTLDVVVANAGIVPPWRETEALDFAEWDGAMAVNARGVAATLKHAAPLMKERGGAIIVMCSINAFRAHPRQMLYTASKHAALGIVRAAALDLGRYGIRVNGLAPGPIATEALLGRVRARAASGGLAEGDALAALARETALGRMATEDDVARAALFLASPLASGVTGQLLAVDAGLL
jgi:NAD(P)-dependent dehydrogenase (short-subunit alcohol dehydrogenase family)